MENNTSIGTQETLAEIPDPDVQYVRSISGSILRELPVGGTAIVAGIVRDCVTEQGPSGQYHRFAGDFAASVNGVIYRAQTLYMPGFSAEMLAEDFAVFRDNGNTDGMEFRWVLRKSPSTRSPVGYVWVADRGRPPDAKSDRAVKLLAG